jgi:hypothetical protein
MYKKLNLIFRGGLIFLITILLNTTLLLSQNDIAILKIDKLQDTIPNMMVGNTYYLVYTITNISNTKAIIDSVQSTCGGLYVSIQNTTIEPNESTFITAEFIPQKAEAAANKSINIFTKHIIQYNNKTTKQTGTWSNKEPYTYITVCGSINENSKEQKNNFENNKPNIGLAANYIRLNKQVADAGKIPEGPTADFEFSLTNISKEPIIITNVQSSCGCVVPTFNKEPILPGKTDYVKARYSTIGRIGVFNKSLIVHLSTANGLNMNFMLQITGEVLPPENKIINKLNK